MTGASPHPTDDSESNAAESSAADPGGPDASGPATHPAERLLQAVTVALLVLSSAAQWLAPAAEPETEALSGHVAGVSAELEIQGRYLLGVDELLRRSGQDRGQAQASFDAVVSSTPRPVDRLRLSALALAIDRPGEAAELIDSVRGELDEREIAPFAALLQAHGGGLDASPAGEASSLDAEAFDPEALDAEALAASHGFFGELAAAIAGGSVEEPRRSALRLALLLVFGALAVFAAVVLGCILAAVGYLRWREGRLSSGYRRQTALQVDASRQLPAELQAGSRQAFLETVLVAILGLQVLGAVVAFAMAETAGAEASPRWPLMLNWLLLPLLLWPLLRGQGRASFLAAMGWTRGRGFIVEMGCGFLGYIAAAPLLVLGFLCSALVARLQDQPPHHPILDWVQGAGTLDLVLIIAVATLWAPIVEESLFRGAFFHYLRARWGPLASAFAVSLAFAALHPQGLAGLPFLICLAMSLAMIREWRGSLIAPITVHFVHNGLVMGLVLSLL